MRINFFEEMPKTGEDLDKARMTDFPSTVYLAARSFKDYEVLRQRLAKKNSELEPGYWPILKDSRWISPYSNTQELEILLKDFESLGENDRVLLDLEFPFTNPILFQENCMKFSKNKRLIKELFRKLNKRGVSVHTAEWCPTNLAAKMLMEIFGVTYSADKFPHKKIRMFYTSVANGDRLPERMRQYLAREVKKQKCLEIALGCISQGVYNERILPAEKLDEDLDFSWRIGFDTVTVFRLGGLMKII